MDIDVRENRIRISGKVERETETNADERPYRYERTFGAFHREYTLPSRVDESAARATCKNGVLTIILPKKPEDQRKKITIERA